LIKNEGLDHKFEEYRFHEIKNISPQLKNSTALFILTPSWKVGLAIQLYKNVDYVGNPSCRKRFCSFFAGE
tara:strand:- start:85 stop:297 length:213 start_codon:yes stop_codon:yes gene_type:complete